MHVDEKNLYELALLQIEGIGPTKSRLLIEHFGNARSVLEATEDELNQLGNNGQLIISARDKKKLIEEAQKEIDYCASANIEIISYSDSSYPARLRHCSDAPQLLFKKGRGVLNIPKVLAIVGTRNISNYGKEVCKQIISELAKHNVVVVSGLAYGVDINIHQLCLEHDVPTIGVLAHGLDMIYPSTHKGIAKSMEEKGGLLSEFRKGTIPDKENFPKRNRIVAGMCDATIVIESAIKGGSMITASLAMSYNRDVFAVPGNINQKNAEGCNHLIKTNQANLFQSYKDLAYVLGWNQPKDRPRVIQKELFIELNADEQKLIDWLKKENQSIDELAINCKLPMSKVSSQLVMLEFKGLVKQLPGKIYELC